MHLPSNIHETVIGWPAREQRKHKTFPNMPTSQSESYPPRTLFRRANLQTGRQGISKNTEMFSS